MKDIKFIQAITDTMEREHKPLGNCIYFELKNGNRAKAYCEEYGVCIEVINKVKGKVDVIDLPFKNYFKPTQCSANAPKWYQHIDGDKWYFEKQYTHVLPTYNDFKNLSNAMEEFIAMYE